METNCLHTVTCNDCSDGVVEIYNGDEVTEFTCGTCEGTGKVEAEVWGCDCYECLMSFYVCKHSKNDLVSRHDTLAAAIIAAVKNSEKSSDMFLVYQGQSSNNELAWFYGNQYKFDGQLTLKAA